MFNLCHRIIYKNYLTFVAVLCSQERADNFMASSKARAHRQSTGETRTFRYKGLPTSVNPSSLSLATAH